VAQSDMKFALIVQDNRVNGKALITFADKQLTFLSSDWDALIDNETRINSLADYNNLVTSKQFWLQLEKYERVLICQTDAQILRKGIEEFLMWDYVGAPWKFQEHGGNGGFSLRNPKAMLECINNAPYEGAIVHGYEDVYFSNQLHWSERFKLAPRSVCEKFSCESIFKLGTFGVHAIEKCLTVEQCSLIKNQYK